ncbi:hypothetical protein N792_04370 [Lysobacter concretionis Ko07 = DSM 16239]|uniref:SdpI/YhfL protein family n=1 Tax=Lysobacter concretionis Ko07 = DSM 16239 TaxID=1122185 RepID=A0A0A0EN27_9GAMM|nr:MULTISPECIES: hypothetical protein [Lysobacter]KGM52341.1 hypothetical protein N792_04370 [Lysobacter concretionis Ko07 = DSM 16239]QOD91922.1 hypothetical protein H2514_04625 [Lysobacter sp. CW239]
MAPLLAIVQLLLVPILLGVGLAVRFAGSSRPLNVVNYANVKDAAALHRWAGNRLLLLPVGFLISGLVSLREPGLSALLFGIMVAAILIVGIWLTLGAEKF